MENKHREELRRTNPGNGDVPEISNVFSNLFAKK